MKSPMERGVKRLGLHKKEVTTATSTLRSGRVSPRTRESSFTASSRSLYDYHFGPGPDRFEPDEQEGLYDDDE